MDRANKAGTAAGDKGDAHGVRVSSQQEQSVGITVHAAHSFKSQQ